jgi:hypothetical protein
LQKRIQNISTRACHIKQSDKLASYYPFAVLGFRPIERAWRQWRDRLGGGGWGVGCNKRKQRGRRGINGGGSRSPTDTTGPVARAFESTPLVAIGAAAQRPQRQGRAPFIAIDDDMLTSEAGIGGVGSIWRLRGGFRGGGSVASIETGDKPSGCQGQVMTQRLGRGGHIDTGHLTQVQTSHKRHQV